MKVIEFILLSYFIYTVGYTAFFSVASFFYRLPRIKIPSFYCRHYYSKFYLLIPAYKEDAVIVETARKAVHQIYPREFFEVVVIADSLQPQTISALDQLPIKVISVSFEKSTKVNSLKVATEKLPPADYAVILDADNIIDQNFLGNINLLIRATQYQAIQVERRAKNENNRLAILDGISEGINTRIYRQGASAANLSSSISGSGIIIDFNLLRKCLWDMNSIGGFDRELELLLLSKGVKVHYYNGACVRDEKVTDVAVFQQQRKRWISSQYFYLKKYFFKGMLAFFEGDFVFFNSAILRNIQLPRLINLGLLAVLTMVLWPFASSLSYNYKWWPGLLVANIVFTLIAVPRSYFSLQLLDTIKELPTVFVRMIALLFKLKGANENFLHTPHTISDTSR